jgi:hypothetical protein
MFESLSRREFVKLSCLSACGLILKPPPPLSNNSSHGLARVTSSGIYIYSEPSYRSKRLTVLKRDALVTLLSREITDEGPSHNPLWYLTPDGYAHSGYLQLVRWEPQTPRKIIPDGGGLFEITVPFTRSYREPDQTSDPLYRLYYQSVAWVEMVVTGADGKLWYRLLDDMLKVNYFVRAEHLRRIEPEELAPISPDLPQGAKSIHVSIARQEMLAFENDRLVLRTRISSGIQDSRPRENGIPTATPTGRFYITEKTPLRHMGNGRLTDNLEAYELPGVPWVLFFHETGTAFHGTYWHTDFGRPKSHGCVNMHTEEAKWLYRWTLPVIEPDVKLKTGHGTPVFIF